MTETLSPLSRVFKTGLAAAIPKGGLSISEWAATYRYVSPQRTARPGLWSNDVVPFAAGVMDAVLEPDIQKIVFMKSSQVAGTEILINILCYFIHIDPSLMLYIAETEDKARDWTGEAFDPTITESPVLRERLRDATSGKSADNNQRIKRFAGGQLTIGWASSPAQLSSRPARIIAFDEVDAFKPTSEGDPVKLAEARTKTFMESRKIILNSSPRNAETSIIEREYLAGDQREYYVPCPHCDEYQTLRWANVKWDDDPREAYYVCDVSGCVIEHEEKLGMIALGRWIAGKPRNGTASFRINEIYSPFTTWGDMAADFLQAKKHPETLRVFVNTRLGETWKQEERIEYADLQISREEYEAEVPAGVKLLTAGVDVQGDRLEAEIVGWGQDLESWSIDRRVIYGDPGQQEVWQELKDYLTQTWTGETGDFTLAGAAIDTGGHHTSQVYRFCHANKGRRFFAIKGSSDPFAPLIARQGYAGKNPKVRLFSIGTNAGKDEVFSFLKVSEPGPGFCHYPADDRYDEDYLRQLCSEKKVPKIRSGREYWIYEKVSPSARNEALDIRVYAIAAREILNPVVLRQKPRPNAEPAPVKQEPQTPADEIREVVPFPKQPAPEPEKKTVMPPPRRRTGRVRVLNNPFR